MSGSKQKTPAEELIESLLKDVGEEESHHDGDEGIHLGESSEDSEPLDLGGFDKAHQEADGGLLSAFAMNNDYSDKTTSEFEGTRNVTGTVSEISLEGDGHNDLPDLSEALGALNAAEHNHNNNNKPNEFMMPPEPTVALESPKAVENHDHNKTHFIDQSGHGAHGGDGPQASPNQTQKLHPTQYAPGDSDKTVAVAGYQIRNDEDYGDKVKITVGQNRMSSGYAAWNNAGSAESNLAQAENLRIAQEKIIELEQENEKIRQQNEELMAASEIIKERSDLLSQQISEYKNDREGLESSFKNEIVLLKNHLARKDTELQRAQFKAEELDSRLKFDMKKIRVRERELENRLELIRAEKNAIVKNKDEQILDLRRKMDVLQMEVESYRQKCVDLNKSIESSQESFKRTTRALRLAMANLELQEENKSPLKKVD